VRLVEQLDHGRQRRLRRRRAHDEHVVHDHEHVDQHLDLNVDLHLDVDLNVDLYLHVDEQRRLSTRAWGRVLRLRGDEL
jgi:hypothetical protein